MNGPDPLQGNDKYEKLSDLGRGSFGFVQLVKHKRTGQLYAIKFLDRDRLNPVHAKREVVCHSNLCHPHVIQFKSVFLTASHLAIVMEYAPGGDLYHVVRDQEGLQEEQARWFFQQLIVGMDYCHRMGVANRDIKLENILLDGSPRPLVKIADFGYCKSDMSGPAHTAVGTPGCTAPEVIAARAHYDGKRADIWSCGVMLYVMLFSAYPFERPGDRNNRSRHRLIHARIMNVDYRFPRMPAVSAECRDIISKLLIFNPAERLSIPQIQEHPWYRKGLPLEVLRLNDQCVRLNPHSFAGYQSEEEIMRIVGDAMRPRVSGADEDDGIDDLVDDIHREHHDSGLASYDS